MAYQVLARKWRPHTFAEMVGQTHVLRALMNALDTDRLHHAYLFTGTRGVGKTTIARIFAKSLNCETNGVSATPCGQCRACIEIDSGRFVDLIEVDAASRTGVDDTRELLDNVQYAPTRGRYKVYLIDEVHMLTRQSFNALLKTLEEPPPHVKFLLATTDPQKLLPTVLSRCLQFNLKRLPLEQINGHLTHVVETEQVSFEPPALQLLAQAADGSMRDALSLLDQAIAYGAGALTTADVSAMLGTLDQSVVQYLLQALMNNNAAEVLHYVAQLAERNPDFNAVLADLLRLLQKVALAQVLPDSVDSQLPAEQAIADLAADISPEDVQLFYQIALTGRKDLPYAPEPRGGFEMLMLRMLTFRPVNAALSGTVPTPTPSAPPAKTIADSKPAMPPATVTVTPPVTPPPPRSSPIQQAAAALHTSPTPPAVTPSPEAEKKTEPAADVALNHSDDWIALVNALPLGGIVRQLAVNCAWQSRDGQTLHLQLNRQQAMLKNRVVELEKAIAHHTGQHFSITFHITEHATATAAALQQQQAQAHAQQVQADLVADPFVQALQQQFNARIGRIQIHKR